MKNLLIMSIVAIFLILSVPSSAVNIINLSRAMAEFATVSEWMKVNMTACMTKPWTNPLFIEKITEMADAQKAIQQEINSIGSATDLTKAQKVAATYKKSFGCYFDIGVQVERMLSKRAEVLHQ